MLLNWYVGDGTAHKVKKVYLGVNNKARLVYNPEISSCTILQYSSSGADIDYLNGSGARMAGVSIGNYALFAGGRNRNAINQVTAYSKNLVKTTPTALSNNKYSLMATSIGNYALFAGGEYDNSNRYKKVEVYNSSLVKSTAADLTSDWNTDGAATTIGNYAVFNTNGDNTDTYTSSLVKGSASKINSYSCGATSIGDYALFACGYDITANYNPTNKVVSLSSSLVCSTATSLSRTKIYPGAASTSNYAIFAGGSYNSGQSSNNNSDVEAFNSSLVKTTANSLSKVGYSMGCCGNNTHVLFSGGYGLHGYIDDAYDKFLILSTFDNITSVERAAAAGASVGNYLLSAGGSGTNSYSSYVFAYESKVGWI